VSEAASRIESLATGGGQAAAFVRLREQVGLYASSGEEPVPPAATCLIAWRGDRPLACCSLTTAPDLYGAPGVTGMVGHYEALERDAGIALLLHAREALAARGVARVIGPLNGSTWARYRLVLPPAPEDPAFDPPPFLGEPRTPLEYPEQFEAAGFAVVSRYESRIDEAPGKDAADAPQLAARVHSGGIRIRPLDPSRFDDELRTLFDVSLEAFAENPYYAPIDFDLFCRMYEGIRPLIDPGLVLIAEDARGAPLAFQFAFLDPLSRRNERPTRVIIKTIATLPAARGRGLAGHMFDLIRRAACERGCGAVIHALMHVTNFSMNMSARHHTRHFRRYALYQWQT
jgi:GNAT superfamily N-acetyltransferase